MMRISPQWYRYSGWLVSREADAWNFFSALPRVKPLLVRGRRGNTPWIVPPAPVNLKNRKLTYSLESGVDSQLFLHNLLVVDDIYS